MAKEKNDLTASPFAPLSLGKTTASTQSKPKAIMATAQSTQATRKAGQTGKNTLVLPTPSALIPAQAQKSATKTAQPQGGPVKPKPAQGDGVNTGAGGVSLPSTVTINGAAFAVTDPDPGSTAPSWLEFKGLGITGNHVTVSLGYGNSWIFVDEVQFAGVVPEPETYAMMLAGLGLVGAVARRRRQR